MIAGLPLDAYELGEPLAEYKARRFNIIGGPILAAVGFLFNLMACQLKGAFIILGIVGLLLIPFGLLITMFGVSQRGLRVVLYTNGFVHQQARKTQLVRWQDIASIHKVTTRNFINFLYAGKTYTYTIQTKAPARIVLDDKLERVEELGDKIQSEVAKQTAVQAAAPSLPGM